MSFLVTKSIKVDYIVHSWKIWQGFEFDGLAISLITTKFKSVNIYTHIIYYIYITAYYLLHIRICS